MQGAEQRALHPPQSGVCGWGLPGGATVRGWALQEGGCRGGMGRWGGRVDSEWLNSPLCTAAHMRAAGGLRC